jgi:t-SNARE complex subunit (syntaxin)
MIKNVTKRIGEIQQQVVLATTNDKEAELSAELKPLVEETNKKANVAKQILQKLREDTEKMKISDKNVNANGEVRIRENLVSTLTRKFVDVMKEYQSVQTKYKTEIKKKVKRQVQIVKADATSEEIDNILKSGGADQVFKDAILKGEAADSVRNMYMNVADKYQDVMTIEQSVAELHQMFIDFALLTEQQGELLDVIEFQVKAASDYIDEGNSEMVKAIEIQKNIRKQQCCMLITLLVIIGIVVGFIVATKT